MSTEKSTHKKCGNNDFRKLRYFHGMLMTDDHFKTEQEYHNGKRRLLNRLLHGWGVVCGLKIEPTSPASSKVIIRRGFALDYKGNEILVYSDYALDIAEVLNSCSSMKKRPTTQEECEEALAKERENKWYIVVTYDEKNIDPLPVYAPPGGCEEKVCEYSRTREGFCFDLVKKVKCNVPLEEENGPCEKWKNVSNASSDEEKGEVRKFLCEELIMPCPCDYSEDPPVVLGSIDLAEQSREKIIIDNYRINNWDCRRYVITFGLLDFWMRELAPQKLPFDAIVKYAKLGEACTNADEAVKGFTKVCKKEPYHSKIKKDQWMVHGRVLHSSGKPASGLRVNVLDRDRIYDDLLRVATIDKNGAFRVVYNERDFAETGEKKPDIYVEVWDAQRKEMLYSSKENVRYEAGRVEYFDIKLSKQPSKKEQGSRKGSK